MFTGIIQATCVVESIEERPGLKVFGIRFSEQLVNGLQLGASVAVNGACLTVAKIDDTFVSFDIMDETLRKTNLVAVREGGRVNIERSAKMGDEIGGHVMSGHVITTAEIIAIERPENNHVVRCRVDVGFSKYLFEKGFIGLDGASLTLVNVDKVMGTFEVWLIPETLRLTMYSERVVGDLLNVEIDSRTQAIVDTVEAMMKSGDV